VTELLKRDPYDFWFRTQLAEVELLAGNGKKARAMYEGFLARTPWEPGLLNNFAYLLSKLGSDLDRGLTMVKQALEREPSHSPFYLDTEGWLLFRKGQLQEAESRIAQALARSHLGFGESLSESLYHLGVVRAERGNREEATLAFQVASFVDPYGEYGDLARRELLRLGRDPYQ
jgi:tetratricopeptide (TPR) repeat protein